MESVMTFDVTQISTGICDSRRARHVASSRTVFTQCPSRSGARAAASPPRREGTGEGGVQGGPFSRAGRIAGSNPHHVPTVGRPRVARRPRRRPSSRRYAASRTVRAAAAGALAAIGGGDEEVPRSRDPRRNMNRRPDRNRDGSRSRTRRVPRRLRARRGGAAARATPRSTALAVGLFGDRNWRFGAAQRGGSKLEVDDAVAREVHDRLRRDAS